MIRGVAEHGLPWYDNGPIDRFPTLVIAHGTPAHGKVWGIYSPLYPYLVAPIFKLGNLPLVSTFTYALLIPLAVVTFMLAKRFVKSEWYAALASVLTILSTPIPAKAIETTPFPLTVLCATLATYFTVRLVEPEADARPRHGALLCGVSWAAATAAHVLSFPMAIGALALLGARERKRALPALGGFVGGLLPVSLLNHLRFDSYNPISYGKPPYSGPVGMSLGDQARYAIPVAIWALVVIVALVVVRKKKVLIGVVGLAAIVVAVLMPTLHERLVRYATIGFGYLVDVSFIPLDGGPYEKAKDGLGVSIGGWVAKATFQCTPLVMLAPLAFRGAGEKRWPLIALLVPSVALYASFLTRANMPYVHAFGWPWVYHRYTLAALPALLVASSMVIERVRLTRNWAIGALVAGGALCAALATSSDTELWKRVVLLVLPLASGTIAVIAARFAPQTAVARGSIALAATLGIGIALGHDFRAHYMGKYWCDYWADKFVSVVPPRFALVGRMGNFEVLLSTTATHDVQYLSTHFYPDWVAIRPVLDHWRAEGRPIYLHWPAEPVSPWKDITFVKAEPMPDVWRFEFKEPPP
jgi:hypothetical protein